MNANDRPQLGDTWIIPGAISGDMRQVHQVGEPFKVPDWPYKRQVIAVTESSVTWRQFNEDGTPTGVAIRQEMDFDKNVRRFAAIPDDKMEPT